MQCEIPVVLRRADLDVRDAAIVRAVVKAWGCGYPTHWRDLKGSLGGLRFRVLGACNTRSKRRGGGLVEQGWLRYEQVISGTLRPGPRFGGIGSKGTIYELGNWEAS